MSHFCHAEPVEACRDIKHLHSPFDGLRVTVVTFYEFMTYRLYIIVSTSAVSGSCKMAVNVSCFKVFMLNSTQTLSCNYTTLLGNILSVGSMCHFLKHNDIAGLGN